MADDLDGNWVQATGPVEEEIAAKITRGKKRKLSSKGESNVVDIALTEDTAACEKPTSAAAKRRKKKAKRKQGLAEGAEMPAPSAAAEEQVAWAAAKLSASWVAEAKAVSLSPLEAKGFRPVSAWFLPVAPSEKLIKLSKMLPAGWDSKPAPKCVSVVVLCTSAEQAFAAVAELAKASPQKPLVLATHGGGRKGDQVKRQAAALAKGAQLAVATPGRLLRLLDEGHLDPNGLRFVSIDLCRDRKHRDVLSLPETRRDVLSLLRRHCLHSLEGGRVRLVLSGAP